MKMSDRSRREPKPTSKFLDYYITEVVLAEEPKKRAVKNRKTLQSASQVFKHKKLNATSYKKGTSTLEKRKKLKSTVQTPENSTTASLLPVCGSSSEIRRSSRQHKPNQKLKEYVQAFDERKTATSSTSSATPLRSRGGKVAKSASTLKRSKANSNNTPGFLHEGVYTPFPESKHVSVELVDCFEALARDLEKTHPVTVAPPTKTDDNAEDPFDLVFHNKSNLGGRKSATGGNPITTTPKRSLEEDETSPQEEPSFKRQRLTKSVVRNLTRTKKRTEVETAVETEDFDSPSRRPAKRVPRNTHSKLKEQQLPLRKPTTNLISSSLEPRHTPRRQQQRTQLTVKLPVASRTQKRRQEQQPGIKETLKKFLIMGTKVSNAISETLKHNEEALLSKSSAFEKKCLSLVHALARQGADLEEDDMEKVLKLLDEEQEERRIYRHTFLESLRVSHLTNMALYNQMLRLLRTL